MIYEVLRIVVECCVIDIDEESQLTPEEVLGASRAENVVMTRCIFATQMLFMGFSKTTTARILHRTERAVGNMLEQAHQFRMISYAYRIAEAENTIRLRKLMSQNLLGNRTDRQEEEIG